MTQDLSLDELFSSRSHRPRPTPAVAPGTPDRRRSKGDRPEPGAGESVTPLTDSAETVSGGGGTSADKHAGKRVRETERVASETVSQLTVSPETVTAEPSAPRAPGRGRPRGRPAAPVGDRWQDRVRRAAYYVDVDLLERLDSYCRVTEANKSEVVREALEAYLADHSLR